jgi:hypothetical protein
LDTSFDLKGRIKWADEKRQDIFEYGVEFLQNGTQATGLDSLLDQLADILRTQPYFEEGDFIVENPFNYLSRKK